MIGRSLKAWILPHCLSTSPYVEVVNFDVSNFNSGIIAKGKTKPSMLDRDLQKNPPKEHEREIQVQCFPLYSVLKALDIRQVDYFSLDVEGAEYAILNTIPWNNVSLTLMSVEVKHAGHVFPGTMDDIKELMINQGYNYVGFARNDDLYLHSEYKPIIRRRKKHENKTEL